MFVYVLGDIDPRLIHRSYLQIQVIHLPADLLYRLVVHLSSRYFDLSNRQFSSTIDLRLNEGLEKNVADLALALDEPR
ncbi:hypothetical protein BX666DRAFT_2002231 [Dichotomocladium elegans]|nr:hypothetical protein BX666DRAFT_2002231 [Dichotomocladium elegans]